MGNKLIVMEQLDCNDIPKISLCHKNSFPDSFTSKLGMRYIDKMMGWFICSKNRFLFSASIDNVVVGYAGIAEGFGSSSAMIQHTFWIALFELMKRPWLLLDKKFVINRQLIIKNIKNRLYKKKKLLSNTKINTSSKKSMGLVVIGVHPDYSKLGVGTELMDAVRRKSKSELMDRMHLSVKLSNKNAINFYLKKGWEIDHEDYNTAHMVLEDL